MPNLTTAYLAALKSRNTPTAILEVALDSGTVKWGYHSPFPEIVPIVKTISTFQNKLDTKTGYSTRGEVNFVISGRDNFKNLVANQYLKNRRVTKLEGFLADGFVYSDFAPTYKGMITDVNRNGDDLTITVSDDLIDATQKIPVENSTNTQYLDYRNMSFVDVMTNILSTQLAVEAAYVDTAKFNSERDIWFNGWKVSRVLTEPKEANEYLNELQQETNSFIIHDGEKISYKAFAPPTPSETVDEWTDNYPIISGTVKMKSGYKDNFFNRVVFYYDYDESGSSDSGDYFDSAIIATDADSQSAGQWDEANTKTVYSKWFKTYTFSQTSNITGALGYHASTNNGAGSGTLTFTYDATNGSTLQWTPPGGSIGEAVKVTEDGKFDVYGSDTTKFVRVIVTTASLPTSNQTDTVTITYIGGERYAAAVAQKILSRFRDPAPVVSFDIEMNAAAYNSAFIKPTDLKDLTTDEVCEKGKTSWSKERVMITMFKPDIEKGKASVEVLPTRFYRQYGFIAPAGYPNYGEASDAQKKYGYIGHCYIW